MAEASVQPVPCVFLVATIGREMSWRLSAVGPQRTSVAVPGVTPSRCPPFTSTYLGPRACRRRAASTMDATSVMGNSSSKAEASTVLGVMTVASGKRCSMRAGTQSDSAREQPLVATSTGSTTRCCTPYSSTLEATACTISLVGSMPVLRASAPRSPRTESICCSTSATGTTCTPCTPCVFCAVTEVRQLIPNVPSAANVFRSA
mmetsp:Transcript_528/g.1173  ORF Transcript_528/g.1173 Transcript_528/m.1173 type:complete len:204 (-) Transcript_528:66-677(-)